MPIAAEVQGDQDTPKRLRTCGSVHWLRPPRRSRLPMAVVPAGWDAPPPELDASGGVLIWRYPAAPRGQARAAQAAQRRYASTQAHPSGAGSGSGRSRMPIA
jgi:hypothetical protein